VIRVSKERWMQKETTYPRGTNVSKKSEVQPWTTRNAYLVLNLLLMLL
jgi:hypothetical protein